MNEEKQIEKIESKIIKDISRNKELGLNQRVDSWQEGKYIGKQLYGEELLDYLEVLKRCQD